MCEYCDSIHAMTGRRHCPIHLEPPPIAAEADPEREAKLDAERVTLEFRSGSRRRFDAGREPITDSPLFGGPAQQEMF
jgi:hypothetical protein